MISLKPESLRVNFELVDGSPEMGNASEDNLRALKQDGTRLAESVDDELKSFVKLAVQGNKDSPSCISYRSFIMQIMCNIISTTDS